MMLQKRGLMGGVGFLNPYPVIPDLGWWDGIWNVGLGKNDTTSSTWKDLSGGNDFALLNATWGEDNLHNNEETQWAERINSSINGIRCIEAVLDASKTRSVASFYYNKRWNGNAYIWVNYGLVYFSDGLGVVVPETVCYVAANLNENQIGSSELFSNGKVASGIYSDYWVMNTPIMIGSGYSQNPLSNIFKGSIKSIRLHSRTLSASEIAANYAVDKARFNLT